MNVSDITKHFDSVSICLSKGLSAPVGSLLLGNEALITKARRWRKVLGGGMRQAGFLAKAGLFVLQNNVERLEQDHRNAKFLAQEIAKNNGFSVNPELVETNIVFAKLDHKIDQDKLIKTLTEEGILISKGQPMRFVTHSGVKHEDIIHMVKVLKSHFDI